MNTKPSSAEAAERKLEKLVDSLTLRELELLHELLKDYPDIGVEKAIEMLRAAGA